MGASASSEQSVSIEQREAETLASSTGALPTLQKCFSKLADPHSAAIPADSLQQCFRLNYETPVTEALPIPDSFPAVLDQLGTSVVELFFSSEKGGVSWIEFVRGYNRCCARKPLSMCVTTLLRVFTATVKKAGLNCELEFETGDDDCKIGGCITPVDVMMLVWLCWGMSWYCRSGELASGKKGGLCLPDVKHVVLSAVESCGEGESGADVWKCEVSGLEVRLPAGKFVAWVMKTVPGLPSCFTEFVYAVLKHSASEVAREECSTSSDVDSSAVGECSSGLLSPGVAWAISLTLTGSLSEELSRACFPNDANGMTSHLLYRSHLHGRGLNRFWSNVQGYQGPVLVLISATSEDGATKRYWTICALMHQGFENRDLFYGSSGILYAISPVFHGYPPSGKEKNFMYSHLHPTGKVYEAKPKPEGVAFGGTIGNERIYVDEDFSKVTIRHHAVDKTYQSGSLFPGQGFLPVEALITEVEIWGLAGSEAKEAQDSYKSREQLFTEQRRKIDLKTFANWEDSPEKMMMDMMSNPNAVRREKR